jgi:hypothetical protein
MKIRRRAPVTLAAIACVSAGGLAFRHTEPRAPGFVAHQIATGLRGGYQTVAVDLNKDGKLDLIAVASNVPELRWYENPTWTPHVLASGLSGLINVSAADLDADGIPELAVAHGFSTRPDQSTGVVSLLTHGANPANPWTIREIDRVPTAHRLRWFNAPSGEKWLVNSPLAGATAQLPDYKGATPIYYYRAPLWKRELVSDAEQGVVHGIEPVRWTGNEETLLSAGFMGIHLYRFSGGAWTRSRIAAGDPAPWPKSGASDVALGKVGAERIIATIEPWHGNQVVVYRERGGSWMRQVIDTTLVDGHTIVVADLDRDGRDEIIAGQRGGTRAVWIYSAAGTDWQRTSIDDGRMAGAGCAAADLNGDGRVDFACIGTATANLTWYENTGPR